MGIRTKHKKIIESCLEDLITTFKTHPGIFLTEEDVRNHLFHLLFSFFGKPQTTTDNKISISLHSEVRWYGKNQDRKERSDLVLIDVKDLRVDKYGRLPLPSKNYGFNNFFSAIEIKLRRSKYGPTSQRWISLLKKDIDKLKFLRNGVRNKYEPLLYLVALDKKENLSREIENISKNSLVKIVYEHA